METAQRSELESTARANDAPPLLLPGIGLCGAVALLSLEASRIGWLAEWGLSALTLAVLLGMVLGNTVFPSAQSVCAPGLDFVRQKLLRTGIVLYGFRLTFTDVTKIGAGGLLVDAIMILSTFALAVWLGTRWLKLERSDAVLIGAGASICGAAAVLAAGSVVKARAGQVAVAVATVVLFGTIAMFLYPLVHPLVAHAFQGRAGGYGIYVGSTVHEVAQAIAAGSMFDADTANMALVAKLGRVAMLGPFLLLVAAWFSRQGSRDGAEGAAPIIVPWFAFGFLAAAAFNSIVPLPKAVSLALDYSGTLFLAMAMAGLGLGAQASLIRRAGGKPLLLALVLACWLLAGGLAVNLLVQHTF